MDIDDLLKDAQHIPDYMFARRLNKLVRENSRFRNLDSKNRELVLDITDKYRDKLRRGIRISALTIRNDTYRLYRNRLKLGLTEEDLDDIKDILNMFKG